MNGGEMGCSTSCRRRCRTCFYWEELNAGDDLTFAEIERVSATMPRFNEIWLSGGEPMDPRLLEVHKESLLRLYADIRPLYHHYAERLGRRKGWVGKAGYLGNIREYDCDWRRFWDSPERQAEIAGIKKDGCWCTHVCFIHSSLKASRRAQVVNVPLAYLSR